MESRKRNPITVGRSLCDVAHNNWVTDDLHRDPISSISASPSSLRFGSALEFRKVQWGLMAVSCGRFRGFFWKAARIGERLSPWVAVGCFTMGVSVIFF
ncbi:hypothetical protein AAG906_025573 [Vitis piasezkii]